MSTISLCMIVKNEEKTLANCLNSIKDLVDEIIIADTGSTDNTKEIAKQFHGKIYDFPWINDFSAARNFAFSKATKDYILWLDADDILKEADQKLLAENKKTLEFDTDAVYFKYYTAFDENGNPTFSYYRERLVKRINQFKWEEPVHECLHVWGNLKYWDVAVTHQKLDKSFSSRNLDIYEDRIKKKLPLSPRATYYYARELKTHGRYHDSIRSFEDFLDTKVGWKEDCISSCLELSSLYEQVEEPEKAINILYRSFEYDHPRGEICCRLGTLFEQKEKHQQGIFWYQIAANLEIPDSLGFIQPDFYNFVPFIWLAVLYDKVGNREKAIRFHEKAKALKPKHQSVLNNERYFYSN